MNVAHARSQMPAGRFCYTPSIGVAAAWLLAVTALWASHAEFAHAEDYSLVESPPAARRTQTGLAYQINGSLSMLQDSEVVKLPIEASARINFHDIQVGDEHRSSNGSPDRQWVRHFDLIDANVEIRETAFEPKLRPERCVIGISIQDGRRTDFSPAGHLTRDELDLIRLAGDSQLVDLLLPSEKVASGDTWKVDDKGLALLLVIDAVGQSDVECVLSHVEQDVAHVEAAGTVHGAIGGVATEIEVKARLQFDLEQQLVTELELITHEKRSIGHVRPGMDVAAKLRLQRAPLDSNGKLEPSFLGNIPLPPPAELALLHFEPTNERYTLVHDRKWHITGDVKNVTILRFLDRGELIAQCNITPLSARVEGIPTTMDEFQAGVRKTLGDRFAQFVEASEEQHGDQTVLRVVAAGMVEDLPIHWIYYLVKGSGDEMLNVSFTIEGELVEQFGAADRDLIERLKLTNHAPTPARETAARPEDKERK